MSNQINNLKNNNENEHKLRTDRLKIIHQNIQTLTIDRQINLSNLLSECIRGNDQIDFILLTETQTNRNTLESFIKFNHNNEIKENYHIITDHESHDYDVGGKGTAIIMRKSWKPYIQDIKKFDGRATIITFKKNPITLQIGVFYIPTFKGNAPKLKKDDPFNKTNEIPKIIKFIQQHIKRDEDPNFISILGGDWNATINPYLDRTIIENNIDFPREYNDQKPENFIIHTLVTSRAYIDVWRFINPDLREFTHQQSLTNPDAPSTSSAGQRKSKSRIDYFLINRQTLPYIKNVDIDHNNHYLFDVDGKLHHKTITLTIKNPLPIKDITHSTFKRKLLPPTKKLSTEKIKEITDDITNGIKNLTLSQKTAKFISIFRGSLEKAHKSVKKRNINAPRTSRKRRPLNKRFKTILRLINSINHNDTMSTFNYVQYNKLIQKFLPETVEISIEKNLTEIHNKLKRIAKKRHKENVKRHMANRAKFFILNMSKHIDSILDNRMDSSDVLKYIIKDNHIHTEPDEIKTLIQNHYEKIFSNESQRIHDQEWQNDLKPLDFINENIWRHVLNQVTPEELTAVIRKLPKNKSPGPSGITYDDFSILLNSENLIKDLCDMINWCYRTKQIPDAARLSTIINLPKEEYKGNMDKLRPITLLETFRKLLSFIITKRITKIIDKHDLLKGYNYGFRTGRSTTDVLRTLRLIIDDAYFNKKNLQLTSLDIYKAYDTVPFDAISQCCKRIKMPDRLILLIHNFLSQREITVTTPFGYSGKLKATRGVPQGDAISPILWAIFYDPLLTKLQQLSNGYTLSKSEITIPALAYADDLTSITSTNEQLENNLRKMSSYLNHFGMIIRPDKSIIHSNLSSDHPNFPTINTFKINNQPINNILDKTQLVRYLGVYWSLDIKHTKTFEQAFNAMEVAISLIKRKQTPGKICVYLTNAVLLPRLSYRLQFTPLTEYQLNSINSKLRALVRMKYNLPRHTPNFILYDSQYDIKLIDFEQYHISRIMNDLIVTFSRNDITSKALKHGSNLVTNLCKHPEDILQKPTPIIKKS